MGKVAVDGELSLSIGDKEVTLSLYQTPDLSEKDAQNICEMFVDEIAESISENKYVELPPLRFTKETSKGSNINMEAIVIDIDRQDLEEYESMQKALENVDDLKTECDIEDCSVVEWNEEPVKGTEFETFVCEEILELDDEKLQNIDPEQCQEERKGDPNDESNRASKEDKAEANTVLAKSEEVNEENNKLGDEKNVPSVRNQEEASGPLQEEKNVEEREEKECLATTKERENLGTEKVNKNSCSYI